MFTSYRVSHIIPSHPILFHCVASFGELSFNADGVHTRRNAGVVSDGNHGQTRVQVQTGIFTASGMDKVEASNVCVLLHVEQFDVSQVGK